MNKTVKCECGYEYKLEPGSEDWESCPDCDLPYKHIRESRWIRPGIGLGLPETKSTLIMHDSFLIFEFPTPMPNIWHRFWYWFLLGWRWEVTNNE